MLVLFQVVRFFWRSIMGRIFFLRLAVFLWLIGSFRFFLLSKITNKKKHLVARIISGAILCIFIMPFLFTILSIHRVKYGLKFTPKQIFFLPYKNLVLKTQDGVNILAWFIERKKSKKSVIVCHGLGANRSNFISAIKFLADAGYNVLIFDFRGHGESEGHTCSVGIYEKWDVMAAYDYLKKRGDQIYGVGYSMGATALLNCAASGAKFQAIILDSPFDVLFKTAKTRFFSCQNSFALLLRDLYSSMDGLLYRRIPTK